MSASRSVQAVESSARALKSPEWPAKFTMSKIWPSASAKPLMSWIAGVPPRVAVPPTESWSYWPGAVPPSSASNVPAPVCANVPAMLSVCPQAN